MFKKLFSIMMSYISMKKSKFFFLSFLLPVVACMPEVAEPDPYGALPTERQLRWHEMEMYSLIHYTPTTFQNKEWGFGDADPQIFNPQHFDAQQIAAAAASAGFRSEEHTSELQSRENLV